MRENLVSQYDMEMYILCDECIEMCWYEIDECEWHVV